MTRGTAERLLDAAEARLRASGFNGFSFRDLAEDVGIRSASVHHHFPTKEALVERLAERYADRYLAGLAGAPAGRGRIAAHRSAFRKAFERDGLMCLCGMLGAESGGLPPRVTVRTAAFFERVVAHLAEGLDGTVAEPRDEALRVLARLEGAMLLARAMGGIEVFDRATADLGQISD